ncbi:Protein ACCELERATED CELL DEATH 6 [Cardamine amara subsp. amara]|uniref:Protein ACCELERATED CELL DEATH 6 n=1 Tax=Cardamine amara subsp. amara TaxID=228776 RepID=A0ABD1BC56_CARAN
MGRIRSYDIYSSDEEEVVDPGSNDPQGSLPSPNPSTLPEDNGAFEIMNPGILCAVRAGDKVSLLKRIQDDVKLFQRLVDNQGNSILHLAAGMCHVHIVEYTVSKFRNLLQKKNLEGETALHVAARAGNLSVVEILVKSITEFSYDMLIVSKNNKGDTALHAALKGKHADVAFYLVGVRQVVSFDFNNDEVSPLYLAVEAGYLQLVHKMLQSSSLETKLASMFNGRSVVHTAMGAKRRDILALILSQDPRLVKLRNKEGRTCLSFGASIGFYEGIRYILAEFDKPASHLSYVTDDDGFSPIHMAAKEGHVRIVKEFLKHCPDSIELLNGQCQNILHVAAESGKSKVVKYILGLDHKQKRMINEQDLDGNTPLHLATKHWHPNVVSILTWNKGVNLKILNNNGFTALDIAEKLKESGYILRRRLTWMALVSAGAPSGPKPILLNTPRRHMRAKQQNTGKFKDRVNTLMVTATLVATVTFAAGFTLPGGYISSSPDLGMAVLVKKTAFKVFLLCNSMAMFSSVVTIMALIWAQLGDILLIQKAFQLALPLLAIALVSMSIAFMAGVFLVVSHLPWLAYFILAVDSIFLLALMLLIIPYVFSCTRQGFLRYIFYFPYFLMLLVVTDGVNNNS